MPIVLSISKEKIKEFIREHGEDMTAEEIANKLVIGRTTILRIIKEMKDTEPDFGRMTHREMMAKRLDYIKKNLNKPVDALASELSITERYARFLIRKLVVVVAGHSTLNSSKRFVEHHHNGVFNVNARWNWLVG